MADVRKTPASASQKLKDDFALCKMIKEGTCFLLQQDATTFFYRLD